MILMIDNYDSFTYNLVQYLGELGADVVVRRNDAIALDDVEALRPAGVVISPGPCTPSEAGISVPLLRRIMHGKTSPIEHDGKTIFDGLSNPFDATRYHSLLVRRETLPACLEISAWTREGEIMGLRHRLQSVEGVQFHPESILTLEGKRLLENFLNRLG